MIGSTVCFPSLVPHDQSFILCCTTIHLLVVVFCSCLTYRFCLRQIKVTLCVGNTRFQHCIPDWLLTAIKGQPFSSFSVARWLPLPYRPFFILKWASFDLLYSKSGTSCLMKLLWFCSYRAATDIGNKNNSWIIFCYLKLWQSSSITTYLTHTCIDTKNVSSKYYIWLLTS